MWRNLLEIQTWPSWSAAVSLKFSRFYTRISNNYARTGRIRNHLTCTFSLKCRKTLSHSGNNTYNFHNSASLKQSLSWLNWYTATELQTELLVRGNFSISMTERIFENSNAFCNIFVMFKALSYKSTKEGSLYRFQVEICLRLESHL